MKIWFLLLAALLVSQINFWAIDHQSNLSCNYFLSRMAALTQKFIQIPFGLLMLLVYKDTTQWQEVNNLF